MPRSYFMHLRFVFVLDVYFVYTQVTPFFFLICFYYLLSKIKKESPVPMGWTVRAGRFETAVCLLRKMISWTDSPVSCSQRRSKLSSFTMKLSCCNSLTPSFVKLLMFSSSYHMHIDIIMNMIDWLYDKTNKVITIRSLAKVYLEGGARVPARHGKKRFRWVYGCWVRSRRHHQCHHLSLSQICAITRCAQYRTLIFNFWANVYI